MDMDSFAEKIQEYISESNKHLGKSGQNLREGDEVEKEQRVLHVDGLDIKVKDNELNKQRDRSRKTQSPVFQRVASPGVRAAFDMSTRDSPLSVSGDEDQQGCLACITYKCEYLIFL